MWKEGSKQALSFFRLFLGFLFLAFIFPGYLGDTYFDHSHWN